MPATVVGCRVPEARQGTRARLRCRTHQSVIRSEGDRLIRHWWTPPSSACGPYAGGDKRAESRRKAGAQKLPE